jgi:uncharacterized protein (DUF736 family)
MEELTMAYDNRDRGALFKNDRKDGDKSPDYKGSLNFNGTECWLNAWIKTSKDGVKYMALSVKPKLDKPAKPERTYEQRRDDFHDDEIPF